MSSCSTVSFSPAVTPCISILHDGGELDVIREGVIYHCGPVVLKDGSEYRVVAAGPTTSIREEPYQADIIKRFGIKAVIGKGGMGAKTQKAARTTAASISRDWRRGANLCSMRPDAFSAFGWNISAVPKAVWELEVTNFPAVVTIDSHGNNLQQVVTENSKALLAAAL